MLISLSIVSRHAERLDPAHQVQQVQSGHAGERQSLRWRVHAGECLSFRILLFCAEEEHRDTLLYQINIIYASNSCRAPPATNRSDVWLR